MPADRGVRALGAIAGADATCAAFGAQALAVLAGRVAHARDSTADEPRLRRARTPIDGAGGHLSCPAMCATMDRRAANPPARLLWLIDGAHGACDAEAEKSGAPQYVLGAGR